jgi:hypothetical protein
VWSGLDLGLIDQHQAAALVIPAHQQAMAHAERWIQHISNRLDYERTMLVGSGGIAADRFSIDVGGHVLVGDEWVEVLRVNKANGTISSVTTSPLRYWPGNSTKVEIERIKDYRGAGARSL